jgi:hypothetical protein
MNRESFMQGALHAAIFVALEGLYAAPVIAGDGVVVLLRGVPARQAVREGTPGRATSIDVSPDNNVQQMVNGSQPGLKSTIHKTTELGDVDFAAVSTGTPQMSSGVADQTNVAGLMNAQLSGHGLGGRGDASGSVQSIAPMLTGAIGGTVGNAGGSVAGVTSALSGLTGAIMRSSGQ